ncbi:MAG: hypothetical protein B5766_09060 [Candidatus Lumbricidophila eiseniae]|uniref:Antitoxin SocA-like Panacea domain-containing protein n=1 Tax=Candidatus Lumbricidiphila eiseniae TaxID=1969409 RepID=A0A2A6FQF2_9MICO|nr:MAG: hypothetical protein B5766_09060 [Candidatus Lumbricidophila eiseniae]
MADVNDVAAYILEKRGPMSTMKLQKLCYYTQGWSLAWDEHPLFEDPIQAWANGPVVCDLYRKHRGQFSVSTWPHGDISRLTDSEMETIDVVLGSYGDLSGQQLSDMTHEERPWLSARGGIPDGESSEAVIDLDVMQDFFGGLDSALRVANRLE